MVLEEQDQQDLMVTVLGMVLVAVMVMDVEEVEAMEAVVATEGEVVKAEEAGLAVWGVLEESGE